MLSSRRRLAAALPLALLRTAASCSHEGAAPRDARDWLLLEDVLDDE